MAVFLDTGFLIALKNSDDKNHKVAQSWMKRFLKKEFGLIHTSYFVFNEMVTLALIRIKNKELALDLGNFVLNSPRINVVGLTDSDFRESWKKFQKYAEKRLSFTDCTLLVHSERLDCSLIATFDHHFDGLIGTIY